jgi:hypothetical protein
MIVLVLLFLLCGASTLFGFAGPTNGVFLSDGSVSDTQAAINAAPNGATINIPTGTFVWSAVLNVNKAVTVAGAGAGNTIIQDNVTNVLQLPDGPVNPVMAVTLLPNLTTRITGIEFTAGARSSVNQSGIIYMSGINTDNRRGRVDHCKFTSVNNRCGVFVAGALGVTDNCTFIVSNSQFTHDIRHPNWGGQSYGDGSWADDPHFGTDQFWFVEDCTMDYSKQSLYECIDSYSGARWVARHNTLINSRFATHGTETTQRYRGTRAIEIYQNNMTGDNVNNQALSLRSGSSVIYSNTMSGWNVAFPGVFTMYAFREIQLCTPWGGADGTNPWDQNDSRNPFQTASATSGGALTMTVSAANWTANQWVGYSLKNSTAGGFSEIAANTSNTITFKASMFAPNLSFAAGDAYALNLVTTILDQPGVGKGDLINTSSPAWPHQAVETCYEWANTANGIDVGYGPQNNVIQSGIHYQNDTVKPGYTAYTYPHPLRTVRLNAPTNLRVVGN